MFTGQVDTISNKATWISDTIELYDDADNTTTDLSAISPLDIEITVKDLNGCYALATATIENGKVLVPGPGFYWRFEDTDLSRICAGTYKLGVKITMNSTVIDEIIGTIAVIEGN
jgi:hypothetical protein